MNSERRVRRRECAKNSWENEDDYDYDEKEKEEEEKKRDRAGARAFLSPSPNTLIQSKSGQVHLRTLFVILSVFHRLMVNCLWLRKPFSMFYNNNSNRKLVNYSLKSLRITNRIDLYAL